MVRTERSGGQPVQGQDQPLDKPSGRMPGVEKDVKNMTGDKKSFGEKVSKAFSGFIKSCGDALSYVTGSKSKSSGFDSDAMKSRLEAKKQNALGGIAREEAELQKNELRKKIYPQKPDNSNQSG